MDPWLARLATAGLVPRLEVLAQPAPDLSPHALVPLRGVLLDALARTRGAAHVRALWRGELALEVDAALQEAFEERLAAATRAHAEALGAERAARRAGAASPARRGFVLAAPYDPADGGGLGTRACRRAVGELADLGANAVALDLVGVVEPDATRRFGAPAPGTFGEPWSDLAVVATARWARERGMSVALLPRLLLRGSSHAADAMLTDTPASWRRLLVARAAFLQHVGLLGELAHADLLAVGREAPLATTAVAAGLDAWNAHLASQTEEWRRLIAATRAVFGGALTYAADPIEAEHIGFWGDLDLVGVELFQSLARPPHTDAEPKLQEASVRLWESFDAAFDVARRAGRPLLVTGIGFSATRRTWSDPRRPAGPPDAGEQHRMYLALLATLREARERQGERFGGFFLWSWSTDPASGGERDYSPRGRPAEALVRWLLGEA